MPDAAAVASALARPPAAAPQPSGEVFRCALSGIAAPAAAGGRAAPLCGTGGNDLPPAGDRLPAGAARLLSAAPVMDPNGFARLLAAWRAAAATPAADTAPAPAEVPLAAIPMPGLDPAPPAPAAAGGAGKGDGLALMHEAGVGEVAAPLAHLPPAPGADQARSGERPPAGCEDLALPDRAAALRGEAGLPPALRQAIEQLQAQAPARAAESAGTPDPATAAAGADLRHGGERQPAVGVPAAHVSSLPGRLHDPRWTEQFASRVHWLIGEGLSQARIVINPPDLGPIDVRVAVHNEQTSVHFTVAHGAVRDAVEEALPRLREMLQQSGVALDNASVSTGLDRQPERGSAAALQRFAAGAPAHAGGDGEPATTIGLRFGAGLIDTYV